MGRERNIIPDFVQEEIDYIIAKANFTSDEKTLFILRNNQHSIQECAEIMDYSISTINRRMKGIYRKMNKVIENY